jgi:RHS repeat-associated protein
MGNRSQVVDTNGTTTFGYDPMYRLNAVTYPNGDIQSYTYDPMGNRLTKVHNGATTNYTTDDADQMTAAGGVAYGYDNNGNQTSRGTDTFTYNTENRLTATNLAGTAGSYAYNGDGLRTSRTIGATTSTFAWGNATGMPVVLRDSAGNRYLYGLDLISVSDSANKKFYYHTDGLGSTTAITGSTGAVVKTYQCDAYGAVRTQTGTQPNEFTFTGEQADSSGLQYLRARYYDAATGRFVGRDPLPLMQRYAYVGGNPVNLVDPSGLCGVSISPSNAADCLGVGAEKLAGAADYAEGYFGGAVDLLGACAGSETCLRTAGILAVTACSFGSGGMAIGVCLAAGYTAMSYYDVKNCATDHTVGACAQATLDVGEALLLEGAVRKPEFYPGTGHNWGFAPFGNRFGRLPHYHRRAFDPLTNETFENGALRWHRPWQKGF